MRYHDLYNDYDDYIPEPEHRAKRERPRDIASLYVSKEEWADFEAVRAAHGITHIVGVKPVPMTGGLIVELLCQDRSMKLPLMAAWADYTDTRPHRASTR